MRGFACSVLKRSSLVSERALQGFRVSFYDAIVSSAKNAELLSAKDPADIRIEECEGNWWSQNSVMRVCDWLNAVRDVSARGAFESQVLEPVRVSARYLSSVRRLSKPTADVDGWVLGVSRPYPYEQYEEDKVTAFAVVPELESVMSARLGAGDGVSAGPCRIGCVQPIPLVNRLHPSRRAFARTGGRPDMAGWNFLKTGFGDVCMLGQSAETECFFEAESAQSEQRHHLGAAFMLACKIEDVCEPNIVVQSVPGKELATMALSEGMATSAGRGGLSEGRYARVLGVQWYGEGEKLPEIFMADAAVSERDALADEIAGHVRARGSVPLEDLKEEYGRVGLAGAGALSVNKGAVSYAYRRSAQDPVADAFIKSSMRLRSLRARFGTGEPQRVGWSDVLDEDKMSARGMARLLKSRTQLRDILAYVQTHIDCTGRGVAAARIADASGMEVDSAKRLLRWLKYLGLAEKKDGLIWSAGAARDALSEAFSEHVGKIEAASDVVSVPELAGSVPQSVVVARLSRPDGGFVPLQDGGRANRLYWVRKGAGGHAVLSAEEKLRKLRAGVLRIARGVSFPVTAEYVAQEAEKSGLPISHLVANLTAESLARAGKFLPSGQSWEYPVAERVADFLSENASGEFKVDDILSEARIAGRDRALVAEALASLAGRGRAAKLSDGIWSFGGGDGRIRSHYTEKIKGRALALLRSRRNGMDRGALIGSLRRFVMDIDSERRLPDPAASITRALAELEEGGLVSGADGVWRAL